ncbi:MAG: patatin-like phospholipase family protein [Rhodospirillales bacterium]|nr:patatin-like phospholipase family protein [Rhodospirillales bacterium]
MGYAFQNLVFEGGGVKGIAYVGAMEVMESKGILQGIKRVGGTSAGAINAVLAALNFSNDEVHEILSSLEFTNFMDDSWGIFRDTNRLIEEFGIYKGDFFRNWVGGLIEEKTGNRNLTFKGLRDHPDGFRDLFVCATNLSTNFSEVFSADHTPRTRIADAVRMSMSIPLFFAAIRRKPGNDVYVDGGVLRNYPIKLFDREKYIDDPADPKLAKHTDYYGEASKALKEKHPNSSPYVFNKQTLGFRLDSEAEIAMFRDGAEPEHNIIEDFFDYAFHLISTLMNAELNKHLHSDDWQRTVYIDTLGVGTTDFNLPNPQKEALVQSGRDGAEAYFQWFDDPNNKAANHPLSP